MENIDETDEKIIEILQEDSRRPFTEIANKLDISEATVRKRVNSMEEDGVIEKFTIEINPKDLGYNTVTLLGLDVEPECFLETVDKMTKIEEVRWVAKSTGDHMIMSEIWTEDSDHLSKVMSEKVGKIEGVRDLCPAILLEKIK